MQYKLRQYFRGLERYTRASAKLNNDRRVSQENDMEWSLAPTYQKSDLVTIFQKNWRLTITLDLLRFVREYEYEYTSLQFLYIYLFIHCRYSFFFSLSNPFIFVTRRDKLDWNAPIIINEKCKRATQNRRWASKGKVARYVCNVRQYYLVLYSRV